MVDDAQISLPAPAADQAYIDVSALEAGIISLPSRRFVKDAPPSEVFDCPSLAFSLRHSKTHAHVVFDLGLRRDIEGYAPSAQALVREIYAYTVPQDVVESLEKGGIRPADVETVILSHLHFDHVGDCTPFTNATFVIGEESRALLDDGYPTNPTSQFLSDSVPRERTRFLTRAEFSTAIAGFPHAFDYFGDGSLYVVDAPGHLGGHVNVLARTSAHGSWIYPGGDTCHDVRLLTGEKEMFYRADTTGKVVQCVHADKDKAGEHIRRVGALRKMKEVHVLVAHDWEWYEDNRDGPAFLPGKIPAVAS